MNLCNPRNGIRGLLRFVMGFVGYYYYPSHDRQGVDILKTLTNFEDSFVSATRRCFPMMYESQSI